MGPACQCRRESSTLSRNRHSRRCGNPETPEAIVIRQPAVYILASARNGTLYIGVTSNLVKRIWEHKNDLIQSFTGRYGVHLLVWYELYETMESAIAKEKILKKWRRIQKLALIEETEPNLEGPLPLDSLNTIAKERTGTFGTE